MTERIFQERIVQGVSVRNAEGEWRVRELQCSFAPGELTLIAGCSGSGKSTLLQVLAGLEIPEKGAIVETGAGERRELKRRELLQSAGYVHQQPEQMFFLPAAADEILYSLKKRGIPSRLRQERLDTVTARCGIGRELFSRSPFTLSGGEKRRIALAAAAAPHPQWLLMDEPTAGLDPSMAAALARELAAWKAEHKARGGGIVIASHELDLFLPLADKVILLRNGSTLGQWRPQEWITDPAPLEAAGLGVPACIRLAAWAGATAADAQSIAHAIAERRAAPPAEAKPPCLRMPGADAANASPAEPASQAEGVTGIAQPRHNRLLELDPRAKWLIYALFSLNLLTAPHWGVTAAGLLAAAGIAHAAGIPARRWLKPLLPFAGFILAAYAISGLQLDLSLSGGLSLEQVGFSRELGAATLKRLAPLLPVLGGGVIFNAVTPPRSIQLGLHELLRRIPIVRRGAEAVSLAVALLFRFLRFLPGELSRMALLAAVRGKPGANPGKLKLRQLPAFFVPLLLSLLHYAEELSMALPARGYGRSTGERTNAAPLRWRRSDGAACLAGLLGVLGMGLLRLLF